MNLKLGNRTKLWGKRWETFESRSIGDKINLRLQNLAPVARVMEVLEVAPGDDKHKMMQELVNMQPPFVLLILTKHRESKLTRLKREILSSLLCLNWMSSKHRPYKGEQCRRDTLPWMMRNKQQLATLCLKLWQRLGLDSTKNRRENFVSKWLRTASLITKRRKRESSRMRRNFRRSLLRGAMLFKSLCVTA